MYVLVNTQTGKALPHRHPTLFAARRRRRVLTADYGYSYRIYHLNFVD